MEGAGAWQAGVAGVAAPGPLLRGTEAGGRAASNSHRERRLGKQWCAPETPDLLLVVKVAWVSWLLASSAAILLGLISICRRQQLHFSLGFVLLCALCGGVSQLSSIWQRFCDHRSTSRPAGS